MNVLCYINKLYKGGAERVMSNLANDLFLKGHSVTVVTDYGSEEDYPLSDGIKRVIFERNFSKKCLIRKIFQNLSRILKLRKIAKETKAEVVVSFIKEANQRALFATSFTSIKNIISVRIDPKRGYKSAIQAKWYKIIYRMADGCVFQTDDARSYYPKSIQEKSQIILNPIAEQFYNISRRDTHEKTIVTCGRLIDQKNHELLINAFKKVNVAFPDYKLIIYGSGPLEKKLQEQINANGLSEAVILAGRCNDVPNVLKNAGIFVLSSDFEGLPNALMEAMALGLPVISTDCSGGGARTLIDNEKNGIIVPCNDVDALADAMIRVMSDSEFAKIISAAGKEKAKFFSSDVICDQWDNYIYELTNNNSV